MSRVNAPMMHALAYARAARPDSLVCLHASTDVAESKQLADEWDRRNLPVPLVRIDLPYRDITRPVLDYIGRLHRESPRDIVAVYVPEHVVTHWGAHVAQPERTAAEDRGCCSNRA